MTGSRKPLRFHLFIDAAVPAGTAPVKVTVDPSDIITKIPGSVFGQNANIWMTQMVTESEGSKQQVSFLNGMHTAILLGEALKHKYGETSRWDLANGWSSRNKVHQCFQ
jgi:hypothetical protein